MELASFDTFNVMLLEDDTGDRIIMESITYDDEEAVGIAYEDSGSSKVQAKNYLLHEPVDDTIQIISEDAFDIFYIQMEQNVDEFYLEQEETDAEEYCSWYQFWNSAEPVLYISPNGNTLVGSYLVILISVK